LILFFIFIILLYPDSFIMSKSQSIQNPIHKTASCRKKASTFDKQDRFFNSDCFIQAISQNSIKELKKLLKQSKKCDMPLIFENNLFHYCLEEGNIQAFSLLTQYGFNYLQQWILDDVLKFECLEVLPLYLKEKQNNMDFKLKFSPNWPNENLIHMLLDNGISQEEICAKFSLKEEFLLFEQILIVWEKKHFEHNLSTEQEFNYIENEEKGKQKI
jgi:hypothetical protein